MLTHSCIRYFHHKPPHRTFNHFCYGNVQQLSRYNGRIPIQETNNDTGNPQKTPAVGHPATESDTIRVHSDKCRERNIPISAAATGESSDPVDCRQLTEEDAIENVQHTVERDICNAVIVSSTDDKHTGKDDRSGGPPLITAAMPLSDFSAKERHVNAITDAANRIVDAVARFIETMDGKSRDGTEPCGLLRFREWWELIEVKICVDGEIISGIPIFIEEDVLRVIDENHSYFIPLEKVDYIRTNDGLSSSFKS